ncbi:type VII secretion system-associated protein [Actinosynnema sp. NPDC050436]|uniref:type VII secretion system-associated protein n=1 Tax=Actinosynnema sp. NPDC050436 TaxID=3155659 RepID=UPI0033E5DE74
MTGPADGHPSREDPSRERPSSEDLPEGVLRQGVLLLLIDSAWTPTDAVPDPPPAAVVGGWPVLPDGSRGRFEPNPGHRPSTPDSPLDPVDAVLGLLARGEVGADVLTAALRDVVLGVAVDERGAAVVRPAPDDVPSVLVTTSPGHRRRVRAAGWRDVVLEQLAAALPDRGVDVLLNPGAPMSLRLPADTVREVARG